MGGVCFAQLADGGDGQIRERGGPLLHRGDVGGGRAAVELDNLGTAGKGVRDHDSHVAAAALVPSRDGHGAGLALVRGIVHDDVVVVVLGLGAVVCGREVFFARHVPLLEGDALLPGRWARLFGGRRVYP